MNHRQIARLVSLVEDAYREGWEDAIRDVDTYNHANVVLDKNWRRSESKKALEEMEK